jgi:hypothetical protein
MKFIILLFLSIVAQGWAQSNLAVFCAWNPPTEPFNNQANILNQYWRNGVSLGAGYETAISTNISLATTIETAYYRWDNFNYQGATFPEISLKSAQGEDSRVWRFFLEGKFKSPSRKIPMYLSTGVGYIVEDIGGITTTYSNLNGPDITYLGSDQIKRYFVHTFGIGLQCPIIFNYGIDIRALYFSDYSSHFQEAIVFGIVYSL